MRERKPYRKKYSQYYGLSFDGYYAVHHIDFNHDNDDISNLMLLPLATHTVYHTTLAEVLRTFPDLRKDDFRIDADYRLLDEEEYQHGNYVYRLNEALVECKNWFMYREQLYANCPYFRKDGTQASPQELMSYLMKEGDKCR